MTPEELVTKANALYARPRSITAQRSVVDLLGGSAAFAVAAPVASIPQAPVKGPQDMSILLADGPDPLENAKTLPPAPPWVQAAAAHSAAHHEQLLAALKAKQEAVSEPVSVIGAPAARPAQPALPPQPALPLTPGDQIVDRLLNGPQRILNAQGLFDKEESVYRHTLADISVAALSALIFPGKTPEVGQRAASNDTERDLAIEQQTRSNTRLIQLAQYRETALRNLQFERNQFEAAKLLAQMFSSSAS